MIDLKEIAKQHIRDLEKLAGYEEYIDDRLRRAFADNPFAISVCFTLPHDKCPRSVIEKLRNKYYDHGISLAVSGYPTIYADLDAVKFERLYRDELKNEVNPKEPNRAIKV